MTFLEVHTSFGNEVDARRITKMLIEERLAACANVFHAYSIYHWKGRIEDEDEVLVILKTDTEHYPALEQRLQSIHPYEIPMIVALPIQTGIESYLCWLSENLAKEA